MRKNWATIFELIKAKKTSKPGALEKQEMIIKSDGFGSFDSKNFRIK